MIEVKLKDSILRKAAEGGMDDFIQAFVDAILDAVGGRLTAEGMSQLTADQITLVGYSMLREEVMDGGFVQLIHNGLGPFFFRNPFDKALASWGMIDLARLVKKAHKLYDKHRKRIEIECDDDEFMALFEQFPDFDTLDDEFVANEERWTDEIACIIDNDIEKFAIVLSE